MMRKLFRWMQVGVYRWWYFLLKLLIGTYLKSHFRLVREGFDKQYALSGAYIVLANHSSNWDPFFINIFINKLMYFVASNTHFRSTLPAIGLRLVGAIPKAKGMADTRAIRRIVQICREGGVLGIFPEGECCWSGDSIAPIPATAKLIKILKLPVAIVTISGAFFAAGRWCRYPHRGSIHIRWESTIPADEIAALSVDELYQRIHKKLSVRQSDDQQRYQGLFTGRSPAQYLERSLFICPACHQLGTLYSTPSTLLCKKCHYRVRYTPMGRFTAMQGKLQFPTISQWYRWQISLFQNILLRITDLQQRILFEPRLQIFIAEGMEPLQKCYTASGSMFIDRIEVVGKQRLSIPLSEIEGFNVQKNEQVEFYHHARLYKFRPASLRSCMLAWKIAVLFLQSPR